MENGIEIKIKIKITIKFKHSKKKKQMVDVDFSGGWFHKKKNQSLLANINSMIAHLLLSNIETTVVHQTQYLFILFQSTHKKTHIHLTEHSKEFVTFMDNHIKNDENKS